MKTSRNPFRYVGIRAHAARLARFRTPIFSLLALAALAALAGLAAAPSAAVAQQDLTEAARECATISADALRLACYDAAFRAPPNARAAVGGEEAPAGRAAGAGEPRGSAATLRQESGEPARAEHSEAAAAPRPESSATDTERRAPREREIRSSRAAPEASDDDSGDLEVTVVEVRRLGQLADVRFVTEDGRVWRQTDGRRVRLPKPPFHAVISLGALGSHFLSPAGATVSLRVTEERP